MPSPFTQDDQDAEDYSLTGKQNPPDNEIYALTGQQQIPSAPPMPPPSAQTIPFRPTGGLPPPLPPPQTPIGPMMAPTPPTSSPQDDLAAFQAQQRAGMAKYGPEQQMAVEEAIMKGRRSPGAIAGNAMTGLADALMQGVARAGPGNFQSSLQNRQDKTDEGYRNAMGKAQEGKMAQMKQEMELAQQDPTSAISRSIQKAYGPTLKQMPGGQNLTDEQIALIPASTMGDISSKKIDLTKALAELANTQSFREASLGMQQATLANTARHEKTEEGIAKGAKALDATKTLAAQGPLKRLTSWATGNPAQTALQNQSAGVDPDAAAYAEKHGITPAEAQAIKDKRTGGQ